MTEPDLFWEQLISGAESVGSPSGPVNLVEALKETDDPFRVGGPSKADTDLSLADRQNLGLVYAYRHDPAQMPSDARTVWLDLLAWMTAKLRNEETIPNTELAAILSVAQAFSKDTLIWERLPEDCFTNHIGDRMKALLSAVDWGAGINGDPLAHITERELLAAFENADENEDWAGLERHWRSIAPSVESNLFVNLAASYLAHYPFGQTELANVLNRSNSVLSILGVIGALSADQLAEVASLANSNRGRFTLVQSLSFKHKSCAALSEVGMKALVALFQELQKDDEEWKKWMVALGRYPVRFKALQTALGRSLVNSSVEAKQTWINTLELTTSRSKNCVAVTACLKAFAALANLRERKELWRLAYERWDEWEFRSFGQNRLTEIAVSELDYALYGYVAENLTPAERLAALKTAFDEMNTVSKAWHSDGLKFSSKWYRALSHWQLIAYGNDIASDAAPWDLPNYIKLPFDPKLDRFQAMTYPTELPGDFR